MEPYRNIVCATGFSRHCDTAVARAAQTARQNGAALTLLHVVEHFPEDRSNLQVAPEDVDPAAYRQRRAHEQLAEQARRCAGMEVVGEVILSEHSARYEIARFAASHQVDLVVVASHGRHGIGALLGSTAGGLSHLAPCDLLVVRAVP